MELYDDAGRRRVVNMDITLQHFLAEFFLASLAGLPISEARTSSYEISGTDPAKAARAINEFAITTRWGRAHPWNGSTVNEVKVGAPLGPEPANDNG